MIFINHIDIIKRNINISNPNYKKEQATFSDLIQELLYIKIQNYIYNIVHAILYII